MKNGEATRVRSEHPALFWARLAAFVLVLTWIIGTPFYRQVLGGKNRHFRAWKMFSAIGLGAVDVRFYQQMPDGTRRKLDRYEVLGQSRPTGAARRRIRGRYVTWRTARQICRKLGPDADVRVVSRIATHDGWAADYSGEENICRAKAPRLYRQGTR